jgi:dipeptidyl aminopeptidase/acylaminoacyl peptidase
VYVQGVREGEPRKVYTDPQPGTVLDVSPDGSRALFLRERSQSDHVLFRIDLDSGTATRLFPQSEKRKVAITSAQYSGDGKRVFLTTDDGTEGSFVIRVEPGSGVISGRYKEDTVPTARIADVIVSPKDDHLAIVVDAGNHTEARILDETLKPVAVVKSPLGTIAGGRFSADGKTFTASLSTPDKPTELFDVDAATGAMKPLRADARTGLAALPKIETTIATAQGADGTSIPLNVYLPSGPPAKKEKLPVIVSVHGGPASSSHVRWNPATLFYTSQGYAVVEPNIRGSTGFGRAYEQADNREKRENALKDVEAVNAWARDQAWCDRDRMVISGGSYGGYMTLLALARQPSLWRAGIDIVGISDLRTFFRSTSGTVHALLVDEFGDPEKDAELVAQYSPITSVDKIAAPLFVYQGQNDPRVPRAEADAIVNALRARKVPVEYMVAANEGHSMDRKENKVEFLARTVRFLDESMPKSAAAPLPVAKNDTARR